MSKARKIEPEIVEAEVVEDPPALESQRPVDEANRPTDSSDAGPESQNQDDPIEVSDSSDPASLGRLTTPNLPAVADAPQLRRDERRADALRLGDVMLAPFDGVVTGAPWMRGDGRVDLRVDSDEGVLLIDVDPEEICHVLVPQWRPGELLDQISGWRARGRLDPAFRRELVQAAL